jgi:HK97 gp10 family phage protein
MALQGLASLKNKLARMPAKAKQRMREALDKNADELISAQRSLAERHRASGRTIKSLQKKQGDHELQVKVFSDFFAARWEEFGTVKTPAIPFFFPPYRILKKRFKSRVRTATSKAVKEVANGGG